MEEDGPEVSPRMLGAEGESSDTPAQRRTPNIIMLAGSREELLQGPEGAGEVALCCPSSTYLGALDDA